MKPSVLVLLGLLAAACGGTGDRGDGKKATSGPSTTAAAPLGLATIAGVVNFTGRPPANPTIDMSEEPGCKAKYSLKPHDPVVTVSGGKLADVVVYVKSGLPEGAVFPARTAPVSLEQDGCLYHPRVFAVMVNEPIRIVNADPVLHNIKAMPTVNRGFNISQPNSGMETERAFTQPEPAVPLECNVHGWMHAWVFVLPHPYFAVSGADGTFSITGLPAGTYTLEAWHQKLGTRTVTVTVPATGSAPAAFSFGG